jgi:CDP-paratose 2-epimerase
MKSRTEQHLGPETGAQFYSNFYAKPVLITGGAGFIGTNLADRLARNGCEVLVYDNLSRPGVERNLAWLRTTHGDRIRFIKGDIRNSEMLRPAVAEAGHVYHFAAQVAVTTSVLKPVDDFAINAGGTLNLLEILRSLKNPPPLLFTSTNKVYGRLAEILLEESATAYLPRVSEQRRGINETQRLEFYSPYGCSKGTADQYVLDFTRIYNLSAVVFRMSCIYGPHQFGTEDQGWVAHFLKMTLEDEELTIFGNGKQVRDLLFVDDLVDALLLAMHKMALLSGQVFNIGGGPDHAVSLLELLRLIEQLHEGGARFTFANWRPGDQAYYVSDCRAFAAATGWQAQTKVPQGIDCLYRWLAAAPGTLRKQMVSL